MIYFMGLPRCGGQTVTQILGDIYPRLKPWHSVEADKWEALFTEECSAVVECFAPIDYCIRSDIRRPHTFVNNIRDIDSWFDSCLRFFDRAKERHWNHPMWRRPPCQWRDYYWEHRFNLRDKLEREGIELHYVSIFEISTYGEFGTACGIEVPDHLRNKMIPNVDRYGRRFAALPPDAFSSQIQAEFDQFLNPITL